MTQPSRKRFLLMLALAVGACGDSPDTPAGGGDAAAAGDTAGAGDRAPADPGMVGDPGIGDPGVAADGADDGGDAATDGGDVAPAADGGDVFAGDDAGDAAGPGDPYLLLPSAMQLVGPTDTVVTGHCYRMTLTLQDGAGAELPAVVDIDVNVSATPAGELHLTSACDSAVTALTVSGGMSRATFYFVGDPSPDRYLQHAVTATDPLGYMADATWSGLVQAAATSVGAGATRSCALADGAVQCWGEAPLGNGTWLDSSDPQQVSGLESGVTMLSVGYYHACAIRGSDLLCWGSGGFGRLGNNDTTTFNTPVTVSAIAATPTSVDAGPEHTCAVVSGGVQCWGRNTYGEIGDGSTTDRLEPVWVTGLGAGAGVTQVSTGSDFTCAVVNGGVQCWGRGNAGRLGNRASSDSLTPVTLPDLPGGSGILKVEAMGAVACALRDTGSVLCWGSNVYGGLGNNDTASQDRPVGVIGIFDAVDLTGSNAHACAATAVGFLYCWGSNFEGMINQQASSVLRLPAPTAVGAPVTAAAAGTNHTCAAVDEEVYCWGRDFTFQLGRRDIGRATPAAVVGIYSRSTSTSLGTQHACSVALGARARCWGSNASGRAGRGYGAPAATSVAYETWSGVPYLSSVGCGANHCCGLDSVAGALYCWGANNRGQLGDGTTAARDTPTLVPSLATSVEALGEGVYAEHTCAVVGGGLYCWGRNHQAQVGDGLLVDVSTPYEVFAAASGVSAVATGQGHTCALVNGGVQCWGDNGSGQLGSGSTSDYEISPVEAYAAGSGVTAITTGLSHSCAIVNGAAFCWGSNGSGRLGDGTASNRSTPTAVVGLGTGVTALSAGLAHSCAAVSGAAWCWGGNTLGELGDASLAQQTTPVQISGLTGVTDVAAGRYFSCAADDENLKCWGARTHGIIGDNKPISNLAPDRVRLWQ